MPMSKWHPPAEVTRHAGSPIPADMEFFVPPSPSIGTVVTADSTLKLSDRSMTSSRRMLVILSGALSAALAIAILLVGVRVEIGAGWLAAIATVAAFVALAIFGLTRFVHRCSYVGDRGIVEYKLSGSRQTKATPNLLLFRDAKDLFTGQTRHYYNGIYTGTTYDYKWVKNDGKTYRLSGQYRSQDGRPKDEDPWYLANSAEVEWSNYRLANLRTGLEQQGYVEFTMSGNPKAVRIGSGFMEFVLKNDSTQRVEVADMKNISLGGGTFQFLHKDSKWWSGKGKYAFSYAKLPNAKLFLLCLDRLVGIRWS